MDPQGEGINEPHNSLDPKPTDGSISSKPQQLQNKIRSSTSPASSHGEVESLSYADRRPQYLDAENEAVRYISYLKLSSRSSE